MRNTMIKKLLLNQGKYETVEGVPPLILEKSLGRNLKDYKLYGNSFQDGTPTPDTPIDVESVGELTKNLYPAGTTSKGWTIISGETYYHYDIYVGANQTVTVSWGGDLTLGQGYYLNVGYTLAQRGNSGGGQKWLYHSTSASTCNKSVTVTTDDNGYVYLNINTWGKFSKLINLQVELGNIATPYEPFGKYKVPVVAQGKNLFNINTYGEFQDKNKAPYVLDISKFAVGTKLTVSTKDAYYYKISDTAGGVGTYQYKSNNYTFTLRQAHIDLGYLFVISPTTWKPETKDNLLNQDVLIEYGDIKTDFEPYIDETYTTNIYLNEPLRKVGEDADCVDFANGKVVRNIGPRVVRKSTTYIPSKQTNVCWFSADFASTPAHIADCIVLSKIFKSLQSKWWINDEGILSHKTSTSGFYFSLRWERLGLVYDGTNVYRVEDVENTTPLTDTDLYNIVGEYFPKAFTEDERTIYYARKTPIEELIDLPQLPTLKGTTVYTVDTIIQPSNMATTYKRR